MSTPPSSSTRPPTRPFLLASLALMVGTLGALVVGEGAARALGLKGAEPGRIFRISNGPELQYPGRAGHTVIDLYGSNPRGSFPVDLNDDKTRALLVAEKFTRVDEARRTNPFGVEFSYNSRGFRDREFTPKLQGVQRVVFVGDSFTEAQGVEEKKSLVRLVEGALRQDASTLEVWNLGVRGHDFPDLENLFEAALDLSPDVVLFSMILNDGDRDQQLTRNWPRLNDWIMVRQENPGWLPRYSHLAAFVADRYAQYQVSRDTTAWYRALYSDENRDGWMRTRAAISRIERRCRERGARFGIALWPLLVGLETGAQYPFEAAHAQIRKGIERSGIPFLDLLKDLQGRDSASLWVHPSDLHPNEIAQALVTPSVTDFVRERLAERSSGQPVAK